MKDEIKEIILDDLKLKDIRYHKCKDKDLSFNTEDYQAHLLLDYITNLQEENEKLKQEQIGKYQTLKDLQEENESLKQSILNAIDKMNSEMVMINDRGYYYTDISALEDILQINDKDFIDYKSRNEKAIEYIEERKNLNWYADGVFVYELLNILNGGDE